ncbi:MAG: element excision factor XisI family protein [Cyanobacteria bacterium J06638_20]
MSANIIYITLRSSKVWIEYDGIEHSITDDLVAAGISKEQIIYAWLFQSKLASSF